MGLGPNNDPTLGNHIFYIGLYRIKRKKIFLSDSIRPRALIFGMKYHLVKRYQACSNFGLSANNGPVLAFTCTNFFMKK